MMVREENQIDQFITRRMLRYCKEAGLNYYESTRAMHLNPHDREHYEADWLESAELE